MTEVLFTDKSNTPIESELAKSLGKTKNLWDELKNLVDSQFAPVTQEWSWSGKNYGWALRLKQKKRAILYLKPCEGYFRVAFALGDKAIEAAQSSGLPEALLNLINTAPKFPEGRAVRIDVNGKKDIGIILKIAEIKMAN
jgi:hypothetical protein